MPTLQLGDATVGCAVDGAGETLPLARRGSAPLLVGRLVDEHVSGAE